MELRMGCAYLNDREFVAAFENCQLSGAMFHHADHVRLTWLYLAQFGEAGAQERILQGIRKTALHHGAPEKFIYTTTVAWVRLVAAACEPPFTAILFEQWVAEHPCLLDKNHLLNYYSSALLQSPAARAGWVAPDIAPLP